jgi:lipooligosaccharide transport system permease protein
MNWSLPSLSWRFVPIWRRNFLVWRKLALTTLLADVADPMIALLAFGYGLGSLLPQVEGVRYIVFLVAGSICVSSLYAATFEATYSAFSRLQIQRTWDAMLNTPLTLDDVVLAELLWAASKSVKSGVAILIVAWALGLTRAPETIWIIPVVFCIGLAGGALALCVSSLAKGYDFFMYHFTLVISPMVFLSGVFFPVSQLPAWLEPLTEALPLKVAVDLVRPLILGREPQHPVAGIALLLFYAAIFFIAASNLMRRRLLK